ncbi:hypothetical protein Pmi06nite_63740 [Planotetraspora mira]|uniref:Uncharacterized protein n=1 Tax=Planotetraspora mira TaxID=58121 RepID=A0A8J3X977_9ACTN|nr:hypothetical protein Pmi06nite_63740 [Planotetraspora mira]
MAPELADAPLDGVALLVPLGIEDGRTPAFTAPLEAVDLLILLDREDRLDATPAQVARLLREEYALSANTVAGRLRGRPKPRRTIRIVFSTRWKYGLSPCWPGLRIRARGRQRRSATR